MERRREGERDDLLRRGPRLSRRPYCASLTPNGVPSTDPRRVYRCAPPTLHPARTAPFAIRLFTTLQAVTTSSSSTRFLIPLTYPLAMPLPTDRTLGAPLLLAANAKAVCRRCTARG